MTLPMILACVAVALAVDVALDPDRRADVRAWWRRRQVRKAKQLRENAAVLARLVEVTGGHRPRPDGRPKQPPRGSFGVPPKRMTEVERRRALNDPDACPPAPPPHDRLHCRLPCCAPPPPRPPGTRIA